MAFNFHRAAEGIVLANSHRGFSTCAPENTFPAFEAVRPAELTVLKSTFT